MSSRTKLVSAGNCFLGRSLDSPEWPALVRPASEATCIPALEAQESKSFNRHGVFHVKADQ